MSDSEVAQLKEFITDKFDATNKSIERLFVLHEDMVTQNMERRLDCENRITAIETRVEHVREKGIEDKEAKKEHKADLQLVETNRAEDNRSTASNHAEDVRSDRANRIALIVALIGAAIAIAIAIYTVHMAGVSK